MDEIRFNQPEGWQNNESGKAETKSMRKGNRRWLLFLIIAAVVVIGGYVYKDKLFGTNPSVDGGRSSEYQAVFLTNGQVYFGKISSAKAEYAVLRDVYYLQVIQPPLQGPEEGQATPQTSQPQVSLVKLGNELHGPTDEMHINREHILFFEDLKEESQVVQTIKSFKENQ